MDTGLILQMNQVIAHRGPDDTGYYCGDNVSLGSNRLAIIDLSPAGHQPMLYIKDGREVRIVYNGEIYNFQELRSQLQERGYQFNSTSDTEVILASYLEWGKDCANKFRGMWSFAIYDKEARILILSRDRFGIKPLYYFADEGRLIFSSDFCS